MYPTLSRKQYKCESELDSNFYPLNNNNSWHVILQLMKLEAFFFSSNQLGLDISLMKTLK